MKKKIRLDKLTENIGLKILALLAAIILWFVIVNVDDPVNYKVYSGITVTTANESVITNAGQIYQVTGNTEQISVTVKATRSILKQITKDDIVAVADFSNIQLNTMVPITITIPSYEGRYSEAVANPKNIQIQVESLDTETFPVSVSVTGSPKSGYFVQSTEVNPDNITVTGPESKVQKIARVQAFADVSGMSNIHDIEADIKYYDVNGEEISSSLLTLDVGEGTVQVTAVIVPVKNVPVEVGCTGTVKDGYEVVEISFEPTTIAVIGKNDDLNSVTSIVIPNSVLDVTGASDDVSAVIDLNDYLPEGISLAEGQTEKLLATAVVEKYGTRTLDYPVGSIAIENIPEGYEVSYGETTQLALVFTGSEKALAALSISNVNVSIDLSGLDKEGEYTARLLVEATNGCEIVEQATVQIILEEKE